MKKCEHITFNHNYYHQIDIVNFYIEDYWLIGWTFTVTSKHGPHKKNFMWPSGPHKKNIIGTMVQISTAKIKS